MQAEGRDDGLVLESVAEILVALSNVVSGDYATRLDASRLPPESPVRRLYEGVSEMIRSLEVEHRRVTAYEAELEEKIATIEAQRAAIQELSTPIIEVWEGVVCLPIIGVVDSVRSAEITEALLGAIVALRARCAIIDITAIQVMDTGTADHFLRMVKAVRLLGATCLLSGINPSIAQTLVHMGVDLSDVQTHRSLLSALTAFQGRRVAGRRRTLLGG